MEEVNLNTLANEIAAEEGLLESVSVAQVKEILGILGRRWRGMDTVESDLEYRAIIDRAGLNK